MSLPIEYFHFPNYPTSYAVQMVANIVGVPLVHSDHIDQSLICEKSLRGILIRASKTSFVNVAGLQVVGDENIMRYLVERYLPLDTNLYPSDPSIRNAHDRLMYDLINIVCPFFVQMQMCSLTIPYITQSDQSSHDELNDEFVDDIAFLDEILRNQSEFKQFMFSDYLTLADITMSAIFTGRYVVELELDELPRFEEYLNRMEPLIPGYEAIQSVVDEHLRTLQRQLCLHRLPENGVELCSELLGLPRLN